MAALSPWGLAVLAAAAAAFLCALREAPRAGADPEDVWGVWPWALGAGFLGAWLYYQAAVGDSLWGTSIQGGMLGGLAAFFLYMRRRRRSVWPLLDAFAPGAALAHAVTRLGCFGAGCCYGRPGHPVQLYEAGLDLALAALVHRRLGAAAGSAFRLYFGGYGAIRFVVGFLRADDAGRLVLGMAHSQYLGLAMLAAALLVRPRALDAERARA